MSGEREIWWSPLCGRSVSTYIRYVHLELYPYSPKEFCQIVQTIPNLPDASCLDILALVVNRPWETFPLSTLSYVSLTNQRIKMPKDKRCKEEPVMRAGSVHGAAEAGSKGYVWISVHDYNAFRMDPEGTQTP